MRLASIFALLTMLIVSLAPLQMAAAAFDPAHPTDCCPGEPPHHQGDAAACPHALACCAWLPATAPMPAATRLVPLAPDWPLAAALAPLQSDGTDPPPPRA